LSYTINPFTGKLDFFKPVTPAGSDTEVQFNDGGALGASSGLTYDDTAKRLTVIDGIVVGDPVNPGIVQQNGSGTLVANGGYWGFDVYAEIGGFYSPAPLSISATDDNSASNFEWDLSWDAVPGASSYLVVVVNDDQNGYYNDWAFPSATTTVTYNGASTTGLTSTFSTPTATLAGEVRSITAKFGDGQPLVVASDGRITLDTDAFIATPSGYLSVNTTSQDGRITVDDPTSNGRNIAMTNSAGAQSTMTWQAPATSGTGYYWMFGADTLASNADTFFIWNLRINRPAMWCNGANANNIVFGGEYAEGTLPAKV
jgi:hypothetical protein